MKIILYSSIFGAAIVLLLSCNNRNDSINSNTTTIDTIHFKTTNIKNVDTIGNYSILDTINKLGGYYKKEVYKDPEKCNYFKGKFILNKPILDSFLLAKLASFLVWNLYDSLKVDTLCHTPKMVIVYIYMSKKDCKDSLNVSNALITPSTPEGFPSVHMFIIKDYKQYGFINPKSNNF